MKRDIYGYFTFTFVFEDLPSVDPESEDDMLIEQAMFKIWLDESNFEHMSFYILNQDFYDAVTSEIEGNYGIHDWSSGEGELMGFTSYEVEKNAVPELMARWKDTLQKEGFKVGDVEYPLTDAEHDERINAIPKDVRQFVFDCDRATLDEFKAIQVAPSKHKSHDLEL